MSKYRLTDSEESKLSLTPITWGDIRRLKVDKVYIRAHSSSATYGPYLVKDAQRCIVCKVDGTDARHYPRDKGLLVSSWKVTTTTSEFKNLGRLDPARAMLESMVTEMSRVIIDKQQELKTLRLQRAVLTDILNQR